MAKDMLPDTSSQFLTARVGKEAYKKIKEQLTPEARALMTKGRRFHDQSDWINALKYYNQAWGLVPDNLDLLTLVAYCLVELNAREQAMKVIERAIQLHGANETMCQLLGVLAMNMHFYNIAERLWQQAIQLNPNNPTNHANFMGALYEQEKFDDVVSYAQQVLPHFPENADLWTILATAVYYTEDMKKFGQFYDEALRIDPYNFRTLNNYGLKLGFQDKALELLLRAHEINPENPEINIGIGFQYLYRGDLAKGWDFYEYRLSPNRPRGQSVKYHAPFPFWNGEPDKNKTIFVMAEQGVGDEILFSRLIPRLQENVGRVVIGCDSRHISLFERSFPGIKAIAHTSQMQAGYINRYYPALSGAIGADEIVERIHLGSLWRIYCQKVTDIPSFEKGYHIPDPERVKEMGERLEPHKNAPLIGFSWASSVKDAKRTRDNFTPEHLVELIKDTNIKVVILQYNREESGLKALREGLGDDRVIELEGVDLKLDIEANYAIMQHLDLIVGPLIAPQAFGIASGVETWCAISAPPWWVFGEGRDADVCRFADNLHWAILQTDYRSWETVKDKLRPRLMELAASYA